MDVDIWIEPQIDAHLWGAHLKSFLESRGLAAAKVDGGTGAFVGIPLDEIGDTVAQQRFVRILCADRPVDAFRIPNHLDTTEFDDVWGRSEPLIDGTRLMSEIDLLVTKMETGRPHDEADMRFLQAKVEGAYRRSLSTCSLAEATKLFEQFSTPELAAFAALNAQDISVRSLGLKALDEMSNQGDPYAAELSHDVQRRLRK